jgi:hypothetical protein
MKVYIQQYGKERTGTNYLKALIARNFDDIVLFDNRLGSKHEPFKDVSTWLRENRIDSRQAYDRLLCTDRYWKARSVPSTDPFAWVHQPVSYEELLGLSDGSLPLRYVVQIKNPLAYAVSVNRFARTGPGASGRPPSPVPLNPGLILKKCVEFNAAYRSYWPLIARGRAVLVRYEDLLEDAIRVLRRLQDQLGLTSKHAVLEDVTTVVAPNLGISTEPFYRSYYANEEYRLALPEVLRESIARVIDWELMQRYGYERGE